MDPVLYQSGDHQVLKRPSTSSPAGRSNLAEASESSAPFRERRPRSASLAKSLLRRLLHAVGDPPIVIVLWTGEEICLSAEPSEGAPRVHIRDAAILWKILFDPFFQFPEAYAEGRVEIQGDLEQVMCLLANSFNRAPKNARWLTWLESALHRGSRNTLSGSRKNIHHHYDLGNDFYRLWLDENLLYTCAYFEEPTASLEQAQCAKMDHVCRKLMLHPGETVIEAGCGWGAFALHMARNYGVKVRAYNISTEQLAEARHRAKAEGLCDRVEFIQDDWRNITGTCDVFASIGMLEHVGASNYRQLGDVIDRCLSRHGRGLIHSIGRNRPQPFDPWIERRIFPGAYPPSLGQMSAIFEPREFSILEVENLRLHYAETLRHWLARYEHSIGVVSRLYDSKFVRMWRMYLAGSVAAFMSGSLQLFQVLFARPDFNLLPTTRAHQYAHLIDKNSRAGLMPEFWGDQSCASAKS